MDYSQFTPTQRKILGVLSDGLPHTKMELHGCLWDEQSNPMTVNYHISNIRKILRPIGQDILCELTNGPGRIRYRHVRLISLSN